MKRCGSGNSRQRDLDYTQFIAGSYVFLLLFLPLASSAHATPTYARQAGQPCTVCHLNPDGGGRLTPDGVAFTAGGHRWPPVATSVATPSRLREILTLALGFVHLTAAVVWFGTIFYVHIVLRPRYALGGLPRSELRLAWACIVLLGATGLPLTVMRFPAFADIAATISGQLLLLKIGLYLFMVCTAAFVTLFIGPRLQALKKGWSANDGREGRPAWVRVGEQIFDVTRSAAWKEGNHMRRHQAGQNLTEALRDAPHGPEKLAGFPAFPSQGASPEHAPIARVFYALAYLNLFVALGILVIIAVRRWA
jgi:predicted heme/steroid binding protein